MTYPLGLRSGLWSLASILCHHRCGSNSRQGGKLQLVFWHLQCCPRLPSHQHGQGAGHFFWGTMKYLEVPPTLRSALRYIPWNHHEITMKSPWNHHDFLGEQNTILFCHEKKNRSVHPLRPWWKLSECSTGPWQMILCQRMRRGDPKDGKVVGGEFWEVV